MSKPTVTFNSSHSLTEENILDIITTALEGGIGYWACLDNTDSDWEAARDQWIKEHATKDNPKPKPCYCDVAYQVLKNGKAIILIDDSYECEQESDGVYTITMDKFKEGCSKYVSYTGKDIKKSIDESNFDADDADMIFQFAAMGEIVYG